GAGGLDDFVQWAGHLGDTTRRGLAPMVIPHVADDESRLLWLPGCLELSNRKGGCAVRLDAGTKGELEGAFSRFGCRGEWRDCDQRSHEEFSWPGLHNG